MKTRRLAGLAAALCLLPVVAHAAPDLAAEFTSLDADKDGFLSVAEYRAPGEILPDMRSPPPHLRGPGGVSMIGPTGRLITPRLVAEGDTRPAAPGEVTMTPTQYRQYAYDQLDVDGDARLSLAEFRAARIRGVDNRFTRSDADRDDRLTLSEYVAGQVLPPSTAPMTEEMKAREAQARDMLTERAAARFRAMDADHDNVLSRGEMVPA